jgi:hypothetical protein
MRFHTISALFTAALLIGCGESAEKAPSERQIKNKLFQASKIDAEAWGNMITSGGMASPAMQPSGGPPSWTLSATLLEAMQVYHGIPDYTTGEAGPSVGDVFDPDEFSVVPGTSVPDIIADISLESRPPSPASFLLPRNITALTYARAGDEITGMASFDVDNRITGTVGFTMRFVDGNWRVVEFAMPNSHLVWTLNDEGLWQVDGNPTE